MTRTRPSDRLTPDDARFETMRRALHMPVVAQTVWHFDRPLDRSALIRFHTALQRGPLARRLVHSRVPGARDRWERANLVSPLLLGDPIADLATWVANRADVPLSPEDGPTWELSYAPLADGGSALSFVTSHVIADGSLALRALEAAATGEQLGVLPSDGTRPRSATPSDGFRALGGAARSLPPLLRRLPASIVPAGPRSARADDGALYEPPVIILDVPREAWEQAAAADGGSSNSLLLALCVEVAVRAGRAEPGSTIDVASPVSTRTEGDLRSNASTAVTVPVRVGTDGRVVSLAEIRASSRDAYAALQRGDARHDRLPSTQTLLPHLPGGVLRRLTPTLHAPLVLAANVGALHPAVRAPVVTAALSVLNRSIAAPTTRGAARRTGAGLTAWWGTTQDTATLCVTGADPDALPDVATLAGHLERVLASRGLRGTPW